MKRLLAEELNNDTSPRSQALETLLKSRQTLTGEMGSYPIGAFVHEVLGDLVKLTAILIIALNLVAFVGIMMSLQEKTPP